MEDRSRSADRDDATTKATLYVVDVENTFGCQPALLSMSAITEASRRLEQFLAPTASDTVLVGCNPAIARAVRRAFPKAAVLARGGPDGAELALLAAVDREVIGSHGRLVLCSGDRSLVVLANQARAAGLRVVNVACRGRRHARYRLAVDSMVDWPPMGLRRSAA